MHDVGAGDTEDDRRIGRHDDAGRNERVLLRNDAHNHGAVGLNRRAKVLLDEFAGKMQAAGVDRFDIRRRLAVKCTLLKMITANTKPITPATT